MKIYEKPTILINDEIAEGIFASSGSSGSSMTVTKGSEVGGNNKFTLSLGSKYVNKHVKITLTANQVLSSGWATATFQISGTSFIFEIWSAPSSVEVTLATADGGSIEIVSTTIEKINK